MSLVSGASSQSAETIRIRGSNTATPGISSSRRRILSSGCDFDNTLGKSDQGAGLSAYDYFNLDDKSIFRDHEPLIAPAPHCTDHEHFYYKEKKLSFTKQEDVYKRSLQAAKKGKTLTFHWRGGYLTREVLKELLDLIRKAGEERKKTPVVNVNWPQAVLSLHYIEEQAQECITMEDANEGEKRISFFI